MGTMEPSVPSVIHFPPRRAPVAPRVQRVPDGQPLPLEQILRPLAANNAAVPILLRGGTGSGKLTALRHVAAALCPDQPVESLETPTDGMPLLRLRVRPGLTIEAGMNAIGPHREVLEMVPWSDDDLIEYLLAVHPAQCRSVMQRVQADPDRTRLAGKPELWTVVLDEMAANESMRFVLSALRQRVWRLRLMAADQQHWGDAVSSRVYENEAMGTQKLPRLMRHRVVEMLVRAEQIADDLSGQCWPDDLVGSPRPLLAEVALLVRSRPSAIELLHRMLWLNEPGASETVSILAAADPTTRPRLPAGIILRGADLHGVEWPGIRLVRAIFNGADLHRANLADSTFDTVRAREASFRMSRLRGARMIGLDARQADFDRADLTGAVLDGAQLQSANLKRARLNGASLRKARLAEANLKHATLVGADLSEATLVSAALDGADLTRARLSSARLQGLNLGDITLDGASLRDADMLRCDMEGLRSRDVDFTGANLTESALTGSELSAARFRDAILRECKLADIDWEGADLRGADLRGSTFHMGSSRSGLVGSMTPCEGSKTGFYTDEFNEQDYKAPEEIRRANLRGADLRRAKLSGVDFYLVDLRNARYTRKQAKHFRRCGAIL